MLVNPISFRLSISIFWNSTWSLYKNYNYKYLFYSDLVFFEFFMFFFKKTMSFKLLDFYPSHIRLYRLYDKLIVNLYYHIAKEEYYFNEIDLIYKDFNKKIPSVKKNSMFSFNRNDFVLNKKKLLKIFKKELSQLIFKSLIWNNNIISLKKNLNLLWKKIKSFFHNKFWNLIKNTVKKYFIYLKKKYVYFFFKYIYIIKNMKKKINNKKIFYINIKYFLKRKIKKIKRICKNLIKNKKNKNKNKINKLEFILYKIKNNFLKINIYKKFNKIKKNILFIDWKKKKHIYDSNNLFYLYKINFLKFIFNQKLWIFNLYFYFLSKYFIYISKMHFLNILKNIELNIFKINMNFVTSNIISKYITSSFKNNYSIYETLKPVLVDLKERMRKKRVAGFKITVSGRFKRAERATYWWRKDGQLLTGTQMSAVDYSTSLHKTKYGVCSINVWLTLGIRGLNQLSQEFPSFYPFFFLLKKKKINYFILKKNNLFFNNLLKKGKVESYNLSFNYVKGFIVFLMCKYLYLNIFFKNMLVKNKNKNIQKIFLPQYCKYKIYLEEYLKKDYIKIIPFIQLKYLKRLNLRNSYKVNFLNKSKLTNLKIFKYKIFL